MKAVCVTAPGRAQIVELPAPGAGPGQVLVRVTHAGVCRLDVKAVQRGPRSKPHVLGHEAAGVVVDASAAGGLVREGERVAIDPMRPCGRCELCRAGRTNLCAALRLCGDGSMPGLMAEIVTVPAGCLVPLPDGASAEAAAIAEPIAVSRHAWSLVPADPGPVLILGAGLQGCLALLRARRSGSRPVAVVEPAPERRQLALRLGADRAVDPCDVAAGCQVAEWAGAGGVPAVLDASGPGAAAMDLSRLLAPGATVVTLSMGHDPVCLQRGALSLREARVLGSFGFTHEEFEEAVAEPAGIDEPVRSLLDVRPLEDAPAMLGERAARPPDRLRTVLRV